MSYIQEILTYDIYIKDDILYLQVPVSGLMNPQYLLKENSLYIFLYNYTQAFFIKDLEDYIIKYIIDGQSYLKESLSYDNNQEHLITLIPS